MTKDEKKNTIKILPAERIPALQAMIKATKSLVDLAEREAQVLAQNDMMTFHILQEEKAFLAKRYEKLSGEFRARVEEFRGSDRGLLDRLEAMQNLLGEKAKANNETVFGIYGAAQKKTASSLLTAQELGQRSPVHIENVENQTQVNGSAGS